MPRLSLSTLVLLPLLTACDTEGDAFDDVEAIAAAKVEMCHFNNGQGEYALIDVAENAVESHVAHGDTLFADDQDCDGLPDLSCPCDIAAVTAFMDSFSGSTLHCSDSSSSSDRRIEIFERLNDGTRAVVQSTRSAVDFSCLAYGLDNRDNEVAGSSETTFGITEGEYNACTNQILDYMDTITCLSTSY